MDLEDELLFVTPPPEYIELKCPICLELLVNRSPYLIECCGKHICGSCIDNLKDKPCPLCRIPSFNKVLDKNHQRAMNSLKVYCTHQEKGCQWSGELKQLSEHVSRNGDCQYEELSCKYECGHKEKRSLITNHETNSCPLRPTVCEYCKEFESVYEVVTKDHYTVCSFYPISCSNGCGQSMKRNVLDNHVTKECVLRKVSCEFAEMGCKWTGRANDLPQHLTDDWRHHITFATLHNSKQVKDEINTLNKMIVQLRSRITTLEDQVDHKVDCVNVRFKESDNTRENDDESISDRVETLEMNQFAISQQVDSLRDQTKKLDGCIHKLEESAQDDTESKIIYLQRFQDQLISKTGYCKAISSNDESLLMKPPDNDPAETTSLIVNNYAHKRAHNNLHGTRESGPIYNEHCIQVKVHCNGIGSGYDSHVSISASESSSSVIKGFLVITLCSDTCDPKYGVINFVSDTLVCQEGKIEKFISINNLDNYLHDNDSLHFKFQFQYYI